MLEHLKSALAHRYDFDVRFLVDGLVMRGTATERRSGARSAVWALAVNGRTRRSIVDFRRITRIACDLAHPHVTPVHDYGERGGILYRALALERGEFLRDRLDREPRLPLTDAVPILRGVAEALVYAHAHGVVHGDLRPECVILHGTHARVSGFGHALAFAHEDEDALLASPYPSTAAAAYRAPELAGGGRVGVAADLYSFGVLAYELLSGQRPFRGSNPCDMLRAQTRDSVVPVAKCRPHLPAGLARLVHRCLEQAPERRCGDAGEARALLVRMVTPPPGYEPVHLYNQGRFLLSRRGQDLRRGHERLAAAARAAAENAVLLAGAADALALAAIYGEVSADPALAHAREAATRALERDAECGAGHAALGFVELIADGAWDRAATALDRAVELDPENAEVRLRRAVYLAAIEERPDAALAECDRALASEPRFAHALNLRGRLLSRTGDHGGAIEALRSAAACTDAWTNHRALGLAFSRAARHQDALAAIATAAAHGGGHPWVLSARARILAAAGRRDAARRDVEQLRGTTDDGKPWPWPAISAAALAAVGRDEDALVCLEAAFQQREPALLCVFLEGETGHGPLDRALLAVRRRIGLPFVR